jgi:hypothetical protein
VTNGVAEHTREALAIAVERRIDANAIVAALDRLKEVRPFRRHDHHSTHPTVPTHPYNAGAATLLGVAVETQGDSAHDKALCHRSR